MQDLLPPSVSAVIGGPLGRRASARSRSATHLLAIIAGLTALPLVVAVSRQGHCLAKGWSGDEQFWRGCFSDLPSQYQLADLGRGLPAWLAGDVRLEQMPLLSGAMAAVGSLVPDGHWLDETRWYMALWVLLVAALAISGVVAVGLTRPHRLDLATQLALSPVYVVAALLSPDMLVVALVLWAMWAWSQGRARLTGVLLGLALLGHLWVVAVAGALVLTALAESRGRALARALAATGGVLAVVLVPLLVMASGVDSAPLRAWAAAGSGYGSPWHVAALLGRGLPVWSVTALALLGLLAAALLGLAFVRGAWRTPSWAQLSALVVPVVAITSKATPVQAALWVVPLAVLAGVSWRTHLCLVAVEAVHATALWLYLGGLSDADKGLPAPWYAVVVLARTLAWGFVLWSVWSTPDDVRGERPAAAAGRDQDFRPVPVNG